MSQKAIALALVAMLAFASVATVSATTPTTTVESPSISSNLLTADFENATQWTDGTTVTDFAANDSKANYTEENTTSTNPEVRLVDNETGEVVRTWTESSLDQTYANDTESDYAYRLNVTHGDLDGVDIRANETKNVTLRYVDNTSVSAENETYTNVSIELTAADDYNNFRVSNSLITSTDLVTFETDGITILNDTFWANEKTFFNAENVGINGSGSTISVDMANQTASNRLGLSLESVSDSTWDKSTLITVYTSDDEKVLVKGYTSLPDEVNASTDTYALIDESSNSVDIHLGDEFEDDTTVSEVSVKTNVGDWAALTRGLDIWASNFEMSDLNPLVVVPDVGGLTFDFDGVVPALGTILPMAVGRRKLA